MGNQIYTTVPATTANLGPGYDVLGLALSLYLSAVAEPAQEWSVISRGEGADLLDTCGENLIIRAYRQICAARGWPDRPMRVIADNSIPIARGLGSSAAAIITGMALAQLQNQGCIDREALFQEAAILEGHPDNIAAAVFGGLQEVRPSNNKYCASNRSFHDSIRVLLVIPGSMKSTAELRTVVPVTLAPEEQAENDLALKNLLDGLARADSTLLRFSESDKRHQPYRLAVQPESQAIFRLLQGINDIAGVFLSGAGTSVGGWVLGKRDPTPDVGRALMDLSIPAEVRLIGPERHGVKGAIREH